MKFPLCKENGYLGYEYAVLTTATVHLLHIQTQRDPLDVYVAVLTS